MPGLSGYEPGVVIFVARMGETRNGYRLLVRKPY